MGTWTPDWTLRWTRTGRGAPHQAAQGSEDRWLQRYQRKWDESLATRLSLSGMGAVPPRFQLQSLQPWFAADPNSIPPVLRAREKRVFTDPRVKHEKNRALAALIALRFLIALAALATLADLGLWLECRKEMYVQHH